MTHSGADAKFPIQRMIAAPGSAGLQERMIPAARDYP